jgi:hypothetical protein
MMGASLLLSVSAMGGTDLELGGVAMQPRLQAMQRFQIPDEIAPAIVPYVGCLLASRGVEVRGSLDPRPRNVEKGADCSGHREAAERNADALLRNIGGRNGAERKAMIEATLAGADDFVRGSHLPPPQSTSGNDDADD